jgi:hypothetical protein
MKVVINACFGEFDLSDAALKRYNELNDYDRKNARIIDRDDVYLVQVVEELGEKSWGHYAELKIVEVPDDVDWRINGYDGREWVYEVHRTWS